MSDQILPTYNEILFYNITLLIGYVWFYNKYKRNSLLLLIVTIFFGGLFIDFGNQLIGKILFGTIKRSNIGIVTWQIVTFIWALSIFSKKNPTKTSKNYKLILTVFIVYCIFFLISSLYINNDSILICLTELYKDIMPFLLFFILEKVMTDPRYVSALKLLFFRLINIQIVFSIIKFLILLRPYEGLVGSITGIQHGGPGTTLPLLGLIYIAIMTKMSLQRKHFLIIIGSLFLGFLAGKRAVWLVFPILFIMLSIYVYREKIAKKLILIAILIPACVYIGLRAMPTLNPDNKFWGSFDPEYAWNYGLQYSTGKENASDNIKEGYGRIGALSLVSNNIISFPTDKILFGYGFAHYRYSGPDNYYNSDYWWGINHKGAITGILLKFFSIGLISTILYILFILLILSHTKNKRLKRVITLFVLFDFIVYNSTILTFPALFILLVFEMLYEANALKFSNTNIKTN